MTASRLILAAFVALLLAGNVILTHNILTAPFPGHNDFVTPWEAARAFWLDGVPVYSDESNARIQTIIYGRPIVEGEFPNYYAYPFYTTVLMLPLVPLSFPWAAAVWMVTLEAVLIVALVLLLDLYRWKPRPLALALLILWMLFFYPSSRGLILGQVSHLVFLFQMGALWALVRGRTAGWDALSGVMLALATAKPQMSYLIVPFLLLWALKGRRWHVLIAFTVVMAILLGVSFAAQPAWVGDWLSELNRYTTYTAVGSPVWVVTQYYLRLGLLGELAVSALLYVLLAWVWYGVLIRHRVERFLWAAMLTLTMTHLVAPRTATTHFVVLVAPLLFYAAWLSRRRRGGEAAWLLAAAFVGPWLHFLTTVAGEFEHPATYLPLPVASLVLLWLTREIWWTEAFSRQDQRT